MTRIGTGEPQYVAPQSNIYTGLALAGVVCQAIAFGWLLVKWGQILDKGPFG